jgi:hypothetical protein
VAGCARPLHRLATETTLNQPILRTIPSISVYRAVMVY